MGKLRFTCNLGIWNQIAKCGLDEVFVDCSLYRYRSLVRLISIVHDEDIDLIVLGILRVVDETLTDEIVSCL